MVGRSVNMEKGNLLGNHYIPTRIVFGTGKIKELSILRMPGKKALIVISKGKSVERNGYLKILTEQLSSVGIGWEVFAEIRENPNTCNVMDGAKAAKESGCDFIIGFGGGSCMDAAKAIAVMSVNKGDIWEYMTSGTGKSRRTTTKPLPVVTIPTNAGSGSSVDPWATITNDVTQEKLGYGYGETFPVLALILKSCVQFQNHIQYIRALIFSFMQWSVIFPDLRMHLVICMQGKLCTIGRWGFAVLY